MSYFARIRSLAPFLQGFLGALLILVIYLAGSWTLTRYREFVVMREVVGQIVAQSQKAQAAQAPKPAAEK